MNYDDFKAIHNNLVNTTTELQRAIQTLLKLPIDDEVSFEILNEKAEQSNSISVKILMKRYAEYNNDFDIFSNKEIEMNLDEKFLKYIKNDID